MNIKIIKYFKNFLIVVVISKYKTLYMCKQKGKEKIKI